MKVLVTAGPTREPIDPVRFISNRSSGKMGCAIAAASLLRGHETSLVAGPMSVAAPAGVRLKSVLTAAEMLDAVKEAVAWCDVLIMAAAVCDWRPAVRSAKKLKKIFMPETLRIERTPDILMEIAALKESRVFIGFAAETGDTASEAARKLREKGLDMVVGNDVSRAGSGFESEMNQAILVTGDAVDTLPLMPKADLAGVILERAEIMHKERNP